MRLPERKEIHSDIWKWWGIHTLSDGGDKTTAKYSTQSLFITEEDVKSP